MTIRLEIDIDENTAALFASLLMDANAVARSHGHEIWTPSELASSLLRQLLEEDAAAEAEKEPNDLQ